MLKLGLEAQKYDNLYFQGDEESGYKSGAYGKGFIWKIKFLAAALHTRHELLNGKSYPLILDIGGANGFQSLYFNRVGFRSVNLDVSDWSRRESKTGRHIQGDALFLPFADESFDALYCNDVMEHFTKEGVKQMLEETKRVLKAGGVGILVPVTDLEAKRKGETEEDNKRKGHISLFPRDEWKEMIKASGLEIRNPRFLTRLLYVIGRFYPLKKAWIPTARDGIFIIEKPSDI